MTNKPIEPAEQTPLQTSKEGEYLYDASFLSRIIEAAIMASGQALSVEKLLTLFDEDKKPRRKQLSQILHDLRDNKHNRGFVLKEVASGWRFEICNDLAPWINRLWEEKPQKYSRALLETLSLIAYRQPLTRSDIEDVRGVAVSSHTIKTLSEREWIKVIGHRDVPGRPALYATTRQFLDYFGLKSLEQLPSLSELQDIETINAKLNSSDNAKLNSFEGTTHNALLKNENNAQSAEQKTNTQDIECKPEALETPITTMNEPEKLEEDEIVSH